MRGVLGQLQISFDKIPTDHHHSSGQTVLEAAIRQPCLPLVCFLLERGGDPLQFTSTHDLTMLALSIDLATKCKYSLHTIIQINICLAIGLCIVHRLHHSDYRSLHLSTINPGMATSVIKKLRLMIDFMISSWDDLTNFSEFGMESDWFVLPLEQIRDLQKLLSLDLLSLQSGSSLSTSTTSTHSSLTFAQVAVQPFPTGSVPHLQILSCFSSSSLQIIDRFVEHFVSRIAGV